MHERNDRTRCFQFCYPSPGFPLTTLVDPTFITFATRILGVFVREVHAKHTPVYFILIEVTDRRLRRLDVVELTKPITLRLPSILVGHQSAERESGGACN